MAYDHAITIFSPDGHLFQVEYAQEAVKKGNSVVCVVGDSFIVYAAERKSQHSLQVLKTIRKMCTVDKHLVVSYAGLTADARVLINQTRLMVQQNYLNHDEPSSVEYLAQSLAELKQRYTQSNGRRPFGVSCLISGFDPITNKPSLFQTDPTGTYLQWIATAIGKNDKTIIKFLENHHENVDLKDVDAVSMFAIEALMETVQQESEFIDVAIFRFGEKLSFYSNEKVDQYIKNIIQRKEREQEMKRRR